VCNQEDSMIKNIRVQYNALRRESSKLIWFNQIQEKRTVLLRIAAKHCECKWSRIVPQNGRVTENHLHLPQTSIDVSHHVKMPQSIFE